MSLVQDLQLSHDLTIVEYSQQDSFSLFVLNIIFRGPGLVVLNISKPLSCPILPDTLHYFLFIWLLFYWTLNLVGITLLIYREFLTLHIEFW